MRGRALQVRLDAMETVVVFFYRLLEISDFDGVFGLNCPGVANGLFERFYFSMEHCFGTSINYTKETGLYKYEQCATCNQCRDHVAYRYRSNHGLISFLSRRSAIRSPIRSRTWAMNMPNDIPWMKMTIRWKSAGVNSINVCAFFNASQR
jgi:hypothetical protein